jgi:hypothetical protein
MTSACTQTHNFRVLPVGDTLALAAELLRKYAPSSL